MHGKKRILALLGVPLGASLALAPGISATAHAATPGKSATSGAASQPSAIPAASCSISGVEDPNESAKISGAGFTPGQLVSFISGKRTITTATADGGGVVNAVAVIKADDAVTAQEGANQQGCLNLVKPSATSQTQVPGTTVPGTADEREQALTAGANDGAASCRQKSDLFNENTGKSQSFIADYTLGFNNKVASIGGCSAMLAQLRSGVPVEQNQNQKKENQQENQNREHNRNQNQNQGERVGGQGNR
ncbi:hypothetical protein ACFVT1_20105 [Streptomyces sp. NPDC057963]|uniref:hypothetical protein n=1 Tax=Streptomyces sp. NPDC057963 TaxID=3346290 RepID=UPI0036EC78FF